MNGLIEIEVEVIEFIPNAMSDSYDSGSFAIYDATSLRIITPPHLRGSELTIFHNETVPENSPWRTMGRRLRFSIRGETLESDDLIFDGAIRNLQTLPKREDP